MVRAMDSAACRPGGIDPECQSRERCTEKRTGFQGRQQSQNGQQEKERTPASATRSGAANGDGGGCQCADTPATAGRGSLQGECRGEEAGRLDKFLIVWCFGTTKA